MPRRLSEIAATLFKNIGISPRKLLTLGMCLNVLFIPFALFVVWSMHLSLSQVGEDELKLQKLTGAISRLSETLSMYARLAATTGDSEWEKRYRQIEPKLDETILKVALSARHEYEKNYAAQTKVAYAELISMEDLAFAMVRKGRAKEATEILFGREYDKQKDLYAKGVNQMASAVESRIFHEVNASHKRMYMVGVMGLGGVLILLLAWTAAFVILKIHLNRRKLAEEALAREKERLDVTLRSVGDGVITTDTQGRITLMNRVAESLTGWRHDDALAKPLEEVFAIVNEKTKEKAENPVAKVLSDGLVCGLANNTALIAKDGTERLIEDSGAPIRDEANQLVGVVLVFRDVTEQRRIHQELVRTEKLESVGILAGGIAHDFNNILTAILGHLGLAQMHMDPDCEATQRVADAEKAALRAKDLTQQLLTFSQGGFPIKKTSSIEDLLREWVRFALRGSNVLCDFDIQPDLWPVEIDEAQIGHVAHNLVINADQAMPNGGRILVTAENHVQRNVGSPSLAPGRYVKVAVKDKGEGISPEYRDRIFDPYFTTKERGNGLGLSTSYTTIKKHGGHITVDSLPGQGATFSIYLPASNRKARLNNNNTDGLIQGKGKVLVMDDEPIIREIACDLLSALGYEVSASENGEEAVRIYKQGIDSGEPFDLVIMDLTVPGGMGGKEAIGKLRELDPEVKAVVSSGYSHDPVMGNFAEYGFTAVLAKPYNAQQMSRTLWSVLAEDNEPLDKVS